MVAKKNGCVQTYVTVSRRAVEVAVFGGARDGPVHQRILLNNNNNNSLLFMLKSMTNLKSSFLLFLNYVIRFLLRNISVGAFWCVCVDRRNGS